MGMHGAWNPPSNPTQQSSATRDPREGSAAWRAEQLATGQILIPGRSPQTVDFGVAQPSPPAQSFAPIIVLFIKIVVVVAVATFVWLRFFHSTAPSAEEVEAAFVPVVGFEYGEDSAMTDMVEDYVKDISGFEDEISHFEVKEVRQSGRPVGLVMIGGFEYSDDDQADFDREVASVGATPVSLGGSGKTFTAYRIAQSGANGYIWLDDDGYFFTVVTSLPTHSQTLATTIGSAQL